MMNEILDCNTEEAVRTLYDKFNEVADRVIYLENFEDNHKYTTDTEKGRKILFNWWLNKIIDRCL